MELSVCLLHDASCSNHIAQFFNVFYHCSSINVLYLAENRQRKDMGVILFRTQNKGIDLFLIFKTFPIQIKELETVIFYPCLTHTHRLLF